MSYFILILVPSVLLGLFLALVSYEERIGRRVVLEGRRHLFDTKMARVAFVARHVDWGAFLSDLTRTSIERAVHDIAHATLLGVRFVERKLTELVRTLRSRSDQPLFPARKTDTPSGFTKAMTSIRKSVQRSRRTPELPAAETGEVEQAG